MMPVYIGIVSDSHGNNRHWQKLTDDCPQVKAWFHCGDYCRDAEELAYYADAPVYTVKGNNDYFDTYKAPDEALITVDDIRIYMTHGHGRTLKSMAATGEAKGAQLVLFGHTHRTCEERIGDVTLVNPGSIALPRDGRYGTYALCCLENRVIKEVRFFEIL